jgi:hypothetical protein
MTTPRRPETPAEKELRERNLPDERETRGEEQMPQAPGGQRHPRREGKGGLPDPGDE